MRFLSFAIAAFAFAASACDLSVAGVGAEPPLDATAPVAVDGSIGPRDGGAPASDATLDGNETSDAASDVVAERAPSCDPFDAGASGALALSAFSLKGNAAYDENNDGRITLTNSNKNEKGAAWYPSALPTLGGYELTWSLRVGPNDNAGDGLAFAVLQTATAPDVGEAGDGLGLRKIPGASPGYAVVVDMYKNPTDPTDLAPTTLKLVTLPAFTVVATTAVPFALNDGNTYAVDVSWHAPSSVTATLHTPGGGTVLVSSSDAGLTASGPAFFGFTAATGGGSNSHNEIAGITIASTCR